MVLVFVGGVHAGAVPRQLAGGDAPAPRRPRPPRGRSDARASQSMKVPPFEMPLEEIRASLEKLRRPLSIAVLRARNPFNVGAIIRVAHSFLVREIILVGDEPYYERGAMGMDRYENIVRVADEAELLARVRAARPQADRVREGRGARRPVARRAPRRVRDGVRQRDRTASPTRSSRRRSGRRHPDVRHQPLVPGHGRRRHRHGRVDPPPLRDVGALPERRTLRTQPALAVTLAA